MMRWTVPMAFLALLPGCGGGDTEPLDGGVPLDFDRPGMQTSVSADPCWRQEKGGWHYSVGHCEEMQPPERTTGVFVTAFEERSFFPGERAIPDANDLRRFTYEIELDERRVERLAGREPADPDGEAYLLTFIGRRTQDPWHVDCHGNAYFSYVVDRLISARYLGPMGEYRMPTREEILSQPVIVERRHGGRWGEEEAKAIEFCRGSSSSDPMDNLR